MNIHTDITVETTAITDTIPAANLSPEMEPFFEDVIIVVRERLDGKLSFRLFEGVHNEAHDNHLFALTKIVHYMNIGLDPISALEHIHDIEEQFASEVAILWQVPRSLSPYLEGVTHEVLEVIIA